MKLAIPSYIYASNLLWNRIIKAKPDIVILNPASGPGDQRDDSYQALFTRLLNAEIPTLGYVSTNYGDVPIWKADADRTHYKTLYGPGWSGFFFDEQSPESSRLFYYDALCRTEYPITVLNPGASCDISYATTFAILMTYECSYENYLKQPPVPWTIGYGRTWHCVYSCPDIAAMRRVVKIARDRNAGYLWVTQDPADYDTLPVYFEALRNAIRGDR